MIDLCLGLVDLSKTYSSVNVRKCGFSRRPVVNPIGSSHVLTCLRHSFLHLPVVIVDTCFVIIVVRPFLLLTFCVRSGQSLISLDVRGGQ